MTEIQRRQYKNRNLLNVNTETRFYMDETKKIAERDTALQAVRVLWQLHAEMENLAKPEHPAILDITRREIFRLQTDFGITFAEVIDTKADIQTKTDTVIADQKAV